MTRDARRSPPPGTAHDARNAANRAGYGNRDTPEAANLKTTGPYGREMGFAAMAEYTAQKSVWINVDAALPDW